MRPLFVGFFLILLCHAAAVPTLTNSWTKPGSGDWEDASAWSLGHAPAPGETATVTNQGWKAVAFGPAASSRDVGSIILGGYTDSFNLLLLNYAGLAVPLTAGSVNVGTNSGITALASALTVSTNSGSGDLSLFSVFNQGEQAAVNAQSITLGNVTNAASGFGTYNQTNGIVNAGSLCLWSGSSFTQLDGATAVAGELSMGGYNSSNVGHYSIASGWLTAGHIELERGDFKQTGGSVSAGIGLGAATYSLSAGILQVPGITIPSAHYGQQNPGGFLGADATLLQTGGTNFCSGVLMVEHDYGFAGVGVALLGPGHYVLSNGVLCVSSLARSWMGDFRQWGGWHTNAGTEVDGDIYPYWEIRTGSWLHGGGTLITPYLSVTLGDFTQSGGTNRVSGEVNLGSGGSPASFHLSGGLLADDTTFADGSNNATPGGQPTVFTQSGGTHVVNTLLHLSGRPPDYYQTPWSITAYVLSNGVLNAANIRIENGAYFEHDGGTVTSSGLFTLGYGAWNERTSGQQFGQLQLSAPTGSNATLSLPSIPCQLHFANSSSVAWTPGGTLSIVGWNGSPTGAGQHQIVFGSNASALTPQQVSQIRFINPNGMTGTSPAAILATGEIVPAGLLSARQNGNGLTVQWSGGILQSAPNVVGPYQDVPGATSPYSVPFNTPARFFRLRF